MATARKRRAPQTPKPPASEEQRRGRIAEAAYYNAERRGFQPGGEVDDWLEAERQIDTLAGKGGAREMVSASQPERPGRAASTDESGRASADPDRQRGADGIGRPDFPDLDDAGVPHIEPEEVQRWARELKVSAPRLREAIRRVGPVVEDVKRFLRN